MRVIAGWGAAATIQETCRDYGVGLIPAGGQTSLTLIHEASKIIAARNRPDVHILYIGDHDEAGVNIGESIFDRLYEILRGRWTCALHFNRVAINRDQIDDWGLPTKPAKTTGRNRISNTVEEVESIPVPTLRQLVSDSIKEYLSAEDPDSIVVRINQRRDDLIKNDVIIDAIESVAQGWIVAENGN